MTVPAGRVVSDEDDAVAALAELGGPLALKLQLGPRAAQVRAGRRSRWAWPARPEVRDAYRAPGRAGRPRTTACVLAERMAEPGVELIVAARTDGIVPALVLGLGGIWTELLDDVAIVPLPADAARIETGAGLAARRAGAARRARWRPGRRRRRRRPAGAAAWASVLVGGRWP